MLYFKSCLCYRHSEVGGQVVRGDTVLFGGGSGFTTYLATSGDHTVRGVVQEYLILPLQESALPQASTFYSMPVSTPGLHSLVEAAGPPPVPGLLEHIQFVPADQEGCRQLSWALPASQQREHSLSKGIMPALGPGQRMGQDNPPTVTPHIRLMPPP